MDLDNLKNYVLGWLMWQIGVTPQKYLAVDLKPSVLMYSKPLGMPSYVMALSSALITMHDVEVIRLAVMFTVSLHTTTHTSLHCAQRNLFLGDLWIKMKLAVLIAHS